MTTFNIIIISALTLCRLQADVIELTHGDSLSGTIHAMTSEGVSISSTLSPTPLEIDSANIRNILFDNVDAAHEKHVELVTLKNGDLIPCRVIKFDDDTLKISTRYAGNFDIPRQNIQSIQFGITEEKITYLASDDLDEWSTRKGSWTRSSKGYTCRGAGTLARELELPENLRIKFTLHWQNMPNFVFRFCAENDKATTKQNAYEFLFNSAGIQLNRGVSSSVSTSLTSIDFNPYDITNRTLDVDIRVNRQLGKITLLLDGLERGSWLDPLDAADGNFIILNNRANQDTGCSMGNLVISEWHLGSRQSLEKRNTHKIKDILIDTEDEQYQGQIISISKASSNKRTVIFKVEHAKAALKVPDRRIHTLIFAELNEESPPANSHYTAQLVGGGSIQLDDPTLTKGKISFTHPILGTCSIDTTMIIRIITQKTSL